MAPSYGWIVPEEVIDATLADGLASVRAAFADNSIDELLGRIYRNLPDGKRAQIKTWLAEHSVAIVHGYPHTEQKLPCWVVVIDPEQQSQQYVGDDDHLELVGDEELIIESERWSSTIGIITYAENADLMRWLYQLSKWIVSRARRSLADTFPHKQQPAGRDLQPEQIGEGGRFRYRRALSITVEYDQTDATRDDVTELTDSANEGTYRDGLGAGA